MSWILLEPGDVWSFRDGRPLLTGGGRTTRSIFPPAPLTVQGALRSLLLGHSNVDWDAFRTQSTDKARMLGRIIGHPPCQGRKASLGAFAMRGPFLAREEGRVVRYVPLPADVRRTKGYTPDYFTLQPTRRRTFDTDWPASGLFPLWPPKEQDIEKPEEPEWLSDSSLNDYLHGRAFAGLKATELFGTELRLGIALDYSRRRPKPGMIYQIEFIRPQAQVGLLVHLSDAVALSAQRGAMRIGGEGRSAHYRALSDQQVKADAGLKEPATCFKLVLLTPAYFDGGWQPRDGNLGWSRLLGGPVRLISAALGRPQRIGGWDLAARNGRGWHKPIRAYVPAGSVYFFEADQPLPPPSKSVTHTPADEDLPLDKLGFGQVAVGTWEWSD